MKNFRLFLIGLLLVAAPAAARAQTPADSAGVLLGVAARLKAEGNVQLSRSILDLIISRYANTPAAAEAAQLRSALRTSNPEQGGRPELMVWGTTYGLWLGIAVPIMVKAHGPEPFGVGLIVGGPVGFLVSRAYARSHSLTEGQARAITFGGTWGSWQGLGWANVFNLGASSYCYEAGCYKDNSPSARAAVATTVAGGLAGIAIGSALSHKSITAGTATTVNFGGLWGSWFGVAGATAANTPGDTKLAAALLAGNAGIAVTALGASKWQLSRPRARLISISGVAGGLAGTGALLIAQASGDAAILIPAATSAAGLALGAYWTRNMPKGDALLQNENGKLGFFDAPVLGPQLIERVQNGRLERVPALGLTLQARF